MHRDICIINSCFVSYLCFLIIIIMSKSPYIASLLADLVGPIVSSPPCAPSLIVSRTFSTIFFYYLPDFSLLRIKAEASPTHCTCPLLTFQKTTAKSHSSLQLSSHSQERNNGFLFGAEKTGFFFQPPLHVSPPDLRHRILPPPLQHQCSPRVRQRWSRLRRRPPPRSPRLLPLRLRR